MKRFEDRVVLVTGAGSGIGRATAERFAVEGARVVVADVNDGRVADVVAGIAAAGGAVVGVHLDVSSSSQVDAAIGELLDAEGRLDVVVNNAGVLDGMGPITEVTDDEWQRVIGVNLTGPFNVARRVVPALLEAKGALVNVASIGGLRGGTAGTAYTASKHGVIGLTRNIAFMYAAQGLRCNAVCPGGVNTNIVESSPGFSEVGMARLGGVLATAVRAGDPSEIAAVIAFLASDDASLVNGAVVVADAGWSTS